MKKLLNRFLKPVNQFTVLIFVIVGIEANAQFPYNYSYAGLPLSSKSIVRHFDEQTAVVYYEEGLNGHVALVNVVTNVTYSVSLDTGFFMNDMFIMNDSVFLCGRYYFSSPNYIGCIATMDLNTFSSGSVHTTYFMPSYWIRMDLKRIDGFEYLDGSGNPRAKFLLVADIEYACNGSESFPLNGFEHKYTDENNPSMCTVNAVLEVSYPFTLSGYSSTTQKVLRVINPTIHSEIIHDVVVTDNYVAFVGLKTEIMSNYITLHICNKGSNILRSNYSVFPPQICDFDNYFIYPLGTSSGTPFYHACDLGGDKIAIVTQDEMSTTSSGLTVRTFDLSTNTMINAQELQCYAHPGLRDIAYISNLQKIVMLYFGYFRLTGSYGEIFCTIDPFNMTSSYYLPGITDNVLHYHFSSLDVMRDSYFISTGGKYGFVSDAASFVTGKRCYYVEDYNIINEPVIGVDGDYFKYDQDLPHPTFIYVDTISRYVPIPSHCVDNN